MSNESFNKEEKYKYIVTQYIEFLNSYDLNHNFLALEAKLTSLVSLIKNHIPNLNFVGFYMVKNIENKLDESLIKNYYFKDNKILQIGPYNSDILATPVIEYGKGVVGTCWELNKTVIEEDVSKCKNYIACDDVTKSEICLPLISKNKEFLGVFDIDSTELNYFNNIDKDYLETLLELSI